ncbi:Hypothetical_protein [Hexamita inflata]|uniref:Hypothetical_protein n=1 Tax=Hexamita inflata TaxID=28002 RepID=A0ABP1GSA5_9EUKA
MLQICQKVVQQELNNLWSALKLYEQAFIHQKIPTNQIFQYKYLVIQLLFIKNQKIFKKLSYVVTLLNLQKSYSQIQYVARRYWRRHQKIDSLIIFWKKQKQLRIQAFNNFLYNFCNYYGPVQIKSTSQGRSLYSTQDIPQNQIVIIEASLGAACFKIIDSLGMLHENHVVALNNMPSMNLLNQLALRCETNSLLRKQLLQLYSFLAILDKIVQKFKLILLISITKMFLAIYQEKILNLQQTQTHSIMKMLKQLGAYYIILYLSQIIKIIQIQFLYLQQNVMALQLQQEILKKESKYPQIMCQH